MGRTELLAQRDFSSREISLLTHSWRFAPRHANCWAHVPWARLCDRVRLRVAAHRWLLSLADHRLAQLSPTFPPHHQLWACIGRFEGGPTSVNPNGHYGLLQMHWDWGYGIAGAASDYPQADQEWAAERAYRASGYSHSFLYGQWFAYDGAEASCLRFA